MVDQQLLPISKAAEYLGVTEQTLRRWHESGAFKASFISPGGHRFYSLVDLEKMTKGLFQMAKEWAVAASPTTPSEELYCQTKDRFKVRIERLALEMERNESISASAPLVSSAAGEIGNNSFDHNIGNWPDMPGVFFGYDLGKRVVVLADRGRGILETLRMIRPDLVNHEAALRTAFTEAITGRAPEHRGNGLKFVRKAAESGAFGIAFQTGDSELEISKGEQALKMSQADRPIRGCLCLIKF